MSDVTKPSEELNLIDCEDEPIRIPGSVQPHGVLFVVDEPELNIRQVSNSVETFLETTVAIALTKSLSDFLEPDSFETLRAALQFDLETVNPLTVRVRAPKGVKSFDAVLHRSGSHLLVELEPQQDASESFSASYHSLRNAIASINSSADLEGLCETTANAIRSMTGFDRVMIYRFDEEWNGVVIAEAKHDDHEPFLGLHFPASDIPAQARALYTTQWLRLIADSYAAPSPLVPPFDPDTNLPLDLSDAKLRSVSPIHLEYLRNMGVLGSMSVSLIDNGNLWGLIACHSYSGPKQVPYTVRAASEIIGQTASTLLNAKDAAKDFEQTLIVKSVHAQILDSLARENGDISLALTHFQPTVMELTNATGAVIRMGEQVSTLGKVPGDREVAELADWIWANNEHTFSTNSLAKLDDRWKPISHLASGVIAASLAESNDSYILWFRPEEAATVVWAGDPREKKIVDIGDNTARLGPRQSFEQWVEKVYLRARPWGRAEVQAANELGRHLSSHILRTQQESVEVVRTLHRGLALGELPKISGFSFAARYEPGDGGVVGGDWYDVVQLQNGSVAFSIGDVAGHGIPAAATMGQLRGGLRAFLLEETNAAQAVGRLNELVNWLLPNDLATGIVAIFDPETLSLDIASAGHLPPLLCRVGEALFVQTPRNPALGVAEGIEYLNHQVNLEAGDSVIFFTDGLVESRMESLDKGLNRLARAASGEYEIEALCDHLLATMKPITGAADDTAILGIRRH